MDIKHVALSIGDYPLRAKLIGDTSLDKPVIVLLHGGLDCIEMWKSFPEELARASGLAVVAYERFGHGQSGKLTKPRERDYRHFEAEKVLPEVIKGLGLKKIILVGHSDGGAMALIAAGSLGHQILGICAISPPLVVNKVVCDGIEEAIKQYEKGSLAKRLKVFHGDATDALFYGWARPWLSEAFKDCTWADDIKKIRCPTHVIFGLADVYGYEASLKELQDHLTVEPEVLLLEKVGHMPHHEAQAEVINSIIRLCNKISE